MSLFFSVPAQVKLARKCRIKGDSPWAGERGTVIDFLSKTKTPAGNDDIIFYVVAPDKWNETELTVNSALSSCKTLLFRPCEVEFLE